MPDTLLGRQTNQAKLSQLQTAQHDAPLLGQYMQAVMSGDQNTAKGLLSQFQGDASSALNFAADWQNKQAQLGIQRSELGLRQAQLNASLAAARAKSSQNNALLKALPGLLNIDKVIQDTSRSIIYTLGDSWLGRCRKCLSSFLTCYLLRDKKLVQRR